mmetsp:Transcript_10697/g.17146  ORF Transcript_10697/g.17146 Transcript_10697/m.17146 type:complete len:258 (+) Transcript_10697:1012-1785(+)
MTHTRCTVSTRNTTVLSSEGLNGGPCAQMLRCSSVAPACTASEITATGMFSGNAAASPVATRTISTAYTIQHRWMASCPHRERKFAGWKMERRGRTGDSVCTGVAYENARDAAVSADPLAIIWLSELRIPSRYSTDREYAEMRQDSTNTCCIWMADTSVQRPWRMMSTAERTEGMREVNGAAIEASPSFTWGVSMSSMPSISCIICVNPGLAMAPPAAFCRAACRCFCSFTMRIVHAFMAPNCAHASPLAVRSSNSS